METIKTCPFCGKKAHVDKIHIFASGDQYTYYPRCNTVNCVGNQGWVNFSTEDQAIAAWNIRTNQSL